MRAPSRSAAAMKRSGSGLAYLTWSRGTPASWRDPLQAPPNSAPLFPFVRWSRSPRSSCGGQCGEQLSRTGRWRYLAGLLLVRLGIPAAKPVDALGTNVETGLSKQLVGK